MKTLKTVGRIIVYIIFFGATWILNFLICGIIGSFFYDGNSETIGAVYGFVMIFLPPVASSLETIAFKNKWNEKRRCSPYSTSNPDSVISYIRGNSTEILLEPQANIKSRFSDESTLYKSQYSANRNPDFDLFLVDQMEGHDFEHWCAKLLFKIGFCNVEVTRGSGDQGVDVIAEKDGIRYAIQCKCYSKDLGNGPIQEVAAGKSMPQYRCQIGAVMTNRYFTKGAKDLANATGTLLWDRDWIKLQLQNSAAGSICEQEKLTNSNAGLLEAIIDELFESGQSGTSHIQRKFGLDLEYAEFILQTLKDEGVITRGNGGSFWKPNISHELWTAFKQTHNTQ